MPFLASPVAEAWLRARVAAVLLPEAVGEEEPEAVVRRDLEERLADLLIEAVAAGQVERSEVVSDARFAGFRGPSDRPGVAYQRFLESTLE